MDKIDVIIIGGGITGITTGVVLQLLGLNTEIYAHKLATDPDQSDPRFASLYPAASVLPHSVGTDQLERLFGHSLEVFRLLHRYHSRGMKLHRHYEVFEFPSERPPYLDLMNNVEEIDPGNDPFVPRREQHAELSGWVFNCYLAEWPMYIREMYRWYRSAGGTITRKELMPEDLSTLNADLVVNCSGIWAPQLLELQEPLHVLRGHLLQVRDLPLFRNSEGLVPSYNYTPVRSVYSDPDGNPSDLYFYPRSNGWIFGGSRQPGILDSEGNWDGSGHDDMLAIGGESIPSAIWEVNREILAATFKFKLDSSYTVEASTGYRYLGNSRSGNLILKGTDHGDKKLFNNYGHGGSGVTLSWGCALESARWVKELRGGFGDLTSPRRPILKFLQHKLEELVFQRQAGN